MLVCGLSNVPAPSSYICIAVLQEKRLSLEILGSSVFCDRRRMWGFVITLPQFLKGRDLLLSLCLPASACISFLLWGICDSLCSRAMPGWWLPRRSWACQSFNWGSFQDLEVC